jgi:hypothetical protein
MLGFHAVGSRAIGQMEPLPLSGAALQGAAAFTELPNAVAAVGVATPAAPVRGSASDIVARVKALIPNGWFAYAATNRDAILGGIADGASCCYSLIGYARAQTRLATMSGVWLDLTALDYFGLILRRRASQGDEAFRTRIKALLLQERVTRAGMAQVITSLTGHAPVIFEPWNTGDTGAWDSGDMAWDEAGGWGDTCLPCQTFMIVTRPGMQGIPAAGAWDAAGSAWDTGDTEWVDPSMNEGAVTDADIYQAINMTRPVGSVVWTRLQ